MAVNFITDKIKPTKNIHIGFKKSGADITLTYNDIAVAWFDSNDGILSLHTLSDEEVVELEELGVDITFNHITIWRG